MWLLTLVVYGADRLRSYAHTPTECRSRKKSPRREAEAKRTPTVHPATQAAVGGSWRKPQIAGIEHLRVLQGSDEQHRLRVQVGLLLSMQSICRSAPTRTAALREKQGDRFRAEA